ncbi:Serine/threonine protein kinase, partial [Giardia duodenalis]
VASFTNYIKQLFSEFCSVCNYIYSLRQWKLYHNIP